MKSLYLALAFVLAAGTSVAQDARTPSSTAGRFAVSQYGAWQLHTMNNASASSQTVYVDNCYPNIGTNVQAFFPLATNAPLTIVDGPNTETVTPSQVNSPTPTRVGDLSTGSYTCSFVATFTKAHLRNAVVTSATFGLEEAINDAHAKHGGIASIDASWPGTTAMITVTGLGYSDVTVEDNRAGSISYSWNGSNYVTTAIPVPVSPGLCFTSTGSDLGSWNWSSCAGLSSSNWSDLTPGTGTVGIGSFHVGTGSIIDATGSGAISATSAPWSGLTGTSTAVLLSPSVNQTITGTNLFTINHASVGLSSTASINLLGAGSGSFAGVPAVVNFGANDGSTFNFVLTNARRGALAGVAGFYQDGSSMVMQNYDKDGATLGYFDIYGTGDPSLSGNVEIFSKSGKVQFTGLTSGTITFQVNPTVTDTTIIFDGAGNDLGTQSTKIGTLTSCNTNGDLVAGSVCYPTFASALAALPVNGGTIQIPDGFRETFTSGQAIGSATQAVTVRVGRDVIWTCNVTGAYCIQLANNSTILGSSPAFEGSGRTGGSVLKLNSSASVTNVIQNNITSARQDSFGLSNITLDASSGTCTNAILLDGIGVPSYIRDTTILHYGSTCKGITITNTNAAFGPMTIDNAWVYANATGSDGLTVQATSASGSITNLSVTGGAIEDGGTGKKLVIIDGNTHTNVTNISVENTRLEATGSAEPAEITINDAKNVKFYNHKINTTSNSQAAFTISESSAGFTQDIDIQNIQLAAPSASGVVISNTAGPFSGGADTRIGSTMPMYRYMNDASRLWAFSGGSPVSLSRIKTGSLVPTCTFTSGGGTSPSCAFDTGSSDSAGIIKATTGTGSPGGTGTITLTFSSNTAFGSNKPTCQYMASDAGTAAWASLPVFKDLTPSTTSDIFTWTNGTSPTSLSTSSTYWINYQCWAK